MKIHIVRHGETLGNAKGIYNGSIDDPLNENGIKQAEALAEKIRNIEYDAVISSGMIRAKDTAMKILQGRNLELNIIAEFNERCLGAYQGLTREEIQEKYPEWWTKNMLRQLDEAPDGGESLNQFSVRIKNGLRKLYEKFNDRFVILVCHGATAREINRQLNKISYDEAYDFLIGNCEVFEYDNIDLKDLMK